MPQQVVILFGDACLGINGGVVTRNPALCCCLINRFLSVDEGLEGNMEEAISDLVSRVWAVLPLLQYCYGEVLGT